MCGICGLYGKGDAKLLDKMNRLMVHRGPDDSGAWFDPSVPVGLAMRRLSIIDLSTGRQPVFNEDGSILVVFNGEIYNFVDLRKKLEDRGHGFRTRSDTEVLVHGYEEYGENLPNHIRGMFAFAVWDRKERRLFCARDRFGIKPFYYVQNRDFFCFASEIRPILAAMDRSPSLNRRALIHYLVIGFNMGIDTMFEGIKQLRPGHSLTVSDGGAALKKYWQLPETPADARISRAQAVHDVQDRLVDAVRSHFVSDVPVGLTLSGGLDSSTILAAACRFRVDEGTNGLHAHTIGFGHSSDEISYARLAARGKPVSTFEHICDPQDAVEHLPSVILHMEEPTPNIVAAATWHLASYVARDLKVVLIGEGADEILGGYMHHRTALGIPALFPMAVCARLYRYAFLQPALRTIAKILGGGSDVEEEVSSVFHQEFLEGFSRSASNFHNTLRFDIEHELPNNQLIRVDKMMMAHSIEARVPFLDHGLVEMIWSLPQEMKVFNGVQKYILREAFKNDNPSEVIHRPKGGKRGTQRLFPILFDAGLRQYIHGTLNDRRTVSNAQLSFSGIKKLLSQELCLLPFIGPRIREKLLYTLFTYVIWHKLFLETRVEADRYAPRLREFMS